MLNTAASGVYETTLATGATVYDYTNDTGQPVFVEYASVTGPAVVRCDIIIDATIIDTVWSGAGGSHTWWTTASGRLLRRQGLLPDERLRIKLNGPGAFRIEWYEQV